MRGLRSPFRFDGSDLGARFGVMTARNRNELWARTLLDELARAGVRHVVVAPGSRSTPLVLALADDARFRTAVQVDERSAAFLALGVGKGTGMPAAVVTTSGTAVANLLPAVVEAAQAEVPLLVLTADRPPRLRGADANQAIEQPGIFGGYVRLYRELSPAETSERTLRHLRSVAAQAVAAALGEPAGPVHLNLPFEKPLEPVPVPADGVERLAAEAPLAVGGRADGAPFTQVHARRVLPDEEVLDALAARLVSARRPLLVAGPAPRPFESGPAIEALARALGCPLLADPLSGARSARMEVPGGAYDLAIRVPRVRVALAPDLVVRFGATPSSASLSGWLAELGAVPQVPQVVVDAGGRWKDHLAVASEVVPGSVVPVARALQARVEGGSDRAPSADRDAWREAWARVDRAVAQAASEFLAQGAHLEGAAAVEAARHVARGLEGGSPDGGAPHPILFVSNSMPVRDVDALVPAGFGGDAPPALSGGSALLRILGNRGASGIDGIVSTALGVAWGTGARVTVLLGDLALVHDMNGLLRARPAAPGEPPVNVDFVVVNNDGGGIFHLLPVRDHEPHFTRFVATPHGLEPERIAALHGLPWRRIEGPESTDRLRDGLAWARGHSGRHPPRSAYRSTREPAAARGPGRSRTRRPPCPSTTES
jgi:2-succinyl-5-enolpyruvyl-6-hydroxy-3-cyclohexene-1-carboxylate synthase